MERGEARRAAMIQAGTNLLRHGRASVSAHAPAGRAARKAWHVLGAVSRAILRKSSRTVLVLYALALGAGLGLLSADYATRGRYPFGGVAIGAWKAWPYVGSVGADPYARAINARRAEIPLAVGEGMLLTARTDDQGRRLDATCRYAVGGVVPPARAWTLQVSGPAPMPPGTASERESFTSTEILRDREGRFVVLLSPRPEPGNWLPMRPARRVQLSLRLYDTPVAASIGSLDRENVPAITRLDCAE